MVVKRDGGRIGVTAFAALLFSGCVSSPSTDQEHGTAAATPYRYGVSWGPMGRGGAAERASDYIHVLHQGKSYVIHNSPVFEIAHRPESATAATENRRQPTNIATLIENIVSAIDSAPRLDSSAVRSDNDNLQSIWTRYCRGGEGLTENDWDLLNKAGAPENVPKDLSATCVPPK